MNGYRRDHEIECKNVAVCFCKDFLLRQKPKLLMDDNPRADWDNTC